MKKYVLPLLLSMVLYSCSNSSEDLTVENNTETGNMKASELFVYAGTDRIGESRSIYNKNEELGYSIPKQGKYDVWYYIRIDNNIPGEPVNTNVSNQYFPQTSTGKTLISDLNHGTVNAFSDWRESIVKKFPKYIFSTDGSAVQSVIVDEPTLEDIVAANQNSKYDLSGYLAHKDELHFLWYTCKQQPTDHIWHIDGILTTKDKTDISETIYGEKQIKDYTDAGMVNDKGDVTRKGHVEIDVHQQEHKDWNEIKTSIHMRDTVDIEVFLPIDYQEQADDFDIRMGKDFTYITEIKDTQVTIGGKSFKVEVSIKHEAEGIRILVKPNKEALVAARNEYEDGITFEIHSYVTPGIPSATIWEKLKKTTYKVSPETAVYGQVTSAFYDDKVVF